MRILPRSRRGTWLLATAVWCAACAGLWYVLPVLPRAVIPAGLPVRFFDFAPDGKTVVTFGWADEPTTPTPRVAGRFQFWDCETGAPITEPIEAVTDAFHTRALSPDRRWWYLGSNAPNGRQIQFFDTAARKVTTIPIDIPVSSDRLAFLPDSKVLFVGAESNGAQSIVQWNIDEWRIEGSVKDVTFPIALSGNGRFLAATARHSSRPDTIRIFDRSANQPIGSVMIQDKQTIDHIALDFNGETLVGTLTEDLTALGPVAATARQFHRTLQCWDLATGRERFSVPRVLDQFALANSAGAVITVIGAPEEYFFEWRDLSSGALRKSQAIEGEAMTGFDNEMLNRSQTVVTMERSTLTSSLIESLASRLGIALSFGSPKVCSHTEFFDTSDGRLLGHVNAFCPRWSPAGRMIAAYLDTSTAGRIGIWHAPPRKPLTWFAAGAALLALPIAWLARWRVHQLQAIAA